jgi:hypothetical protein
MQTQQRFTNDKSVSVLTFLLPGLPVLTLADHLITPVCKQPLNLQRCRLQDIINQRWRNRKCVNQL